MKKFLLNVETAEGPMYIARSLIECSARCEYVTDCSSVVYVKANSTCQIRLQRAAVLP